MHRWRRPRSTTSSLLFSTLTYAHHGVVTFSPACWRAGHYCNVLLCRCCVLFHVDSRYALAKHRYRQTSSINYAASMFMKSCNCNSSIATRVGFAVRYWRCRCKKRMFRTDGLPKIIFILNSLLAWIMKTDTLIKFLQKASMDYIKMDCDGDKCYGVLAVRDFCMLSKEEYALIHSRFTASALLSLFSTSSLACR